MAKRKPVYSITDSIGNELRVYTKKAIPHVLNIYLFIFRERKERKLGIINKQNRIIHIVRERLNHLHHKSNSYGFNHMLLHEAKHFDTVLLRDEVAAYKIPREKLLEKGEFLFFKQVGFEKQIFVPLAELELFALKENNF